MTSLRSGPLDRKNITYIVTGASLANDLVKYSSALTNFVQVGTFSTHPSAATITQGYLLTDLGSRLVPGQHPNVPTLMIRVAAVPLDSNGRVLSSFLAGTDNVVPVSVVGYIDPNSPNIAVYSRDRSIDRNDNLYFSGAANLQLAGAAFANNTQLTADMTTALNGAGVRHKGPGVYSGGPLVAAGGVSVTGTTTIGSVTMAVANVVVTYVSATGVLTYTLSNGITNSFAAGQMVNVTGFTSTDATVANIQNAVITTASSSIFTVTIPGLTPSNATLSLTGTGVATVSLPALEVYSGGTVTSGPITAATYTTGTGIYLFTASNTFIAGQTVTVTGVTPTGYNITGVVTSSSLSLTQFQINGTAGLGTVTWVSGGTASVLQKSLEVSAVNTTVYGGLVVASGGLTVSGGPVVEKLITNGTGLTGTINLDLSTGNIFYYSTAVAGATTFTITNAIPGMLFYLCTNSGGFALTFPTNVAVGGSALLANGTVATLVSGSKYLFTCIVIS